MPGEFNVRNALAAASVALDAGLVPERIAELLGGTPPVPGRMEILRREPSIVLRDYAHTPDAYERVLSALRAGLEGRLIVVFGCGGDRDSGKRPLMGEIATRLADLTIVTSDNPRSEDPEAIIDQVVSDLDPTRYEIVPDRREAIVRALEVSGPKDVVALLGKGHETYQIEGDRRVPFDEAKIVAELSGSGESPGGGRGAP
jgi:UDP-N-acetylmuramoyl-L-alanyl-D-glutamate--2,6-diaminopimelate ligase